ncbi:hypothetical protein V3C99_005092 [Haemonchus contortus]|uniref:DUF3560 domain-containing protein n=1 Tax=Haemonchus contortus TaxID=6289 RepID=A0A7I4XU63_HAECO
MQVSLADIRFRNAEEVRKWVGNRIASKDEGFSRPGVNKIPERWQEAVANDEQHIETSREREREREGQGQRQRERQKDREKERQRQREGDRKTARP